MCVVCVPRKDYKKYINFKAFLLAASTATLTPFAYDYLLPSTTIYGVIWKWNFMGFYVQKEEILTGIKPLALILMELSVLLTHFKEIITQPPTANS